MDLKNKSFLKLLDFTPEEINQLLGLEFMSMLAFIKSGRLNQPTPVPQRDGQ